MTRGVWTPRHRSPPGDQVGRNGKRHRRDPRGDRARDRHRAHAAERTDLRRLPARHRLSAGEGELPGLAVVAPAAAEHPVIMAETGVYWSHAEAELQRLAESLGVPVFLNGIAAAAWRPTTSSASAATAATRSEEADVALVIGVPLDFRLGFGATDGSNGTYLDNLRGASSRSAGLPSTGA